MGIYGDWVVPHLLDLAMGMKLVSEERRKCLAGPDERVQKAMFGGCNLNRDIERLVREAGFSFDTMEKYYLEGQTKMSGFMTRGVARPA